MNEKKGRKVMNRIYITDVVDHDILDLFNLSLNLLDPVGVRVGREVFLVTTILCKPACKENLILPVQPGFVPKLFSVSLSRDKSLTICFAMVFENSFMP